MKNTMMKWSCFTALLLAGQQALAASYSLACGTANHSVSTTPATLLIGGAEAGAAGEMQATQWLLNNARGGDYLVLRVGGTGSQAGWVCDNFASSIGSAAEQSIDSRTDANNATIVQRVRNAEILFIAGGDQNQYEDYWKDTALEQALNDHISVARKPIAGTSAGLAILGQSYYAPAGTGVLSKEILDNPFHNNTRDINHGDFLLHPQLANLITDTHLDRLTGSGRRAETRHGRVLGFLARTVAAKNSLNVRAIGVEEGTLIAVDGNGNAKVYGEGRGYFLKPNSYPERIQSGSSLIWNSGGTAVSVYWIQGSQNGAGSFNLGSWSGTGGTSKYWFTTGGYTGFNCQRGC